MIRLVTLSLAALALSLGGCLHEVKLIPYCDGTPASNMPCMAQCKVSVPSTTIPGLVVRVMPNALVIKDERGITRCQEVS